LRPTNSAKMKSATPAGPQWMKLNRGGELVGKVVRCLIGYLLKFSFHGKTEMSLSDTVPAQNSIVDR